MYVLMGNMTRANNKRLYTAVPESMQWKKEQSYLLSQAEQRSGRCVVRCMNSSHLTKERSKSRNGQREANNWKISTRPHAR